VLQKSFEFASYSREDVV